MTKHELDKINKTIRHSRSKAWGSQIIVDMWFAVLQGQRRSAVRFKKHKWWTQEYLTFKTKVLAGPVGRLP